MILFPQKALVFCEVGILVFHFNIAVLPDHDSVAGFGKHNYGILQMIYKQWKCNYFALVLVKLPPISTVKEAEAEGI